MPAPWVLAEEIAEDLRAALAQIEDVLGELQGRVGVDTWVASMAVRWQQDRHVAGSCAITTATRLPAGSTLDMQSAVSVNGVIIRLTGERWSHIVDNKPYMNAYEDAILESIESPTIILAGYAGSLIAVRALGRMRFLHVVYREATADDGFVITAYIALKYNQRQVVWPHKS